MESFLGFMLSACLCVLCVCVLCALLCAFRVQTAKELSALARRRTPEGQKAGEVLALPADLSTADGCALLATALQAREQSLHILVRSVLCVPSSVLNVCLVCLVCA